jgi:hypothetical protein
LVAFQLFGALASATKVLTVSATHSLIPAQLGIIDRYAVLFLVERFAYIGVKFLSHFDTTKWQKKTKCSGLYIKFKVAP